MWGFWSRGTFSTCQTSSIYKAQIRKNEREKHRKTTPKFVFSDKELPPWRVTYRSFDRVSKEMIVSLSLSTIRTKTKK